MKVIIRNVLLIAIAALCIIYPVYTLIIDNGFLHWAYTDTGVFSSPSGKLMLEVTLWFLIALAGIRWHNVKWIIGVLIVFIYAHVMFLPMLFAVLYCVLTILVGMFLMKYTNIYIYIYI